MIRSAPLPLLPGNQINTRVGQTRFHKSQHLEFNNGVAYLSGNEKAGIGGGPLPYSSKKPCPSIYAQGDTLLPAWIAYDKIMLAFDAFLKEKIPENKGYNYIVRKCKIYFFMEDSTIKVMEKKNPKSAFPQVGCIIGRQKIPYPVTGNKDDYYDVIDFNVGKNVELLGRVFHITDCDVFTRTFLNRLGIPVPDPLPTPDDPFEVMRSQDEEAQRRKIKEPKNIKTLDEFLNMDSRVLSFDGYWDDRATQFGYLHLIKLCYHISDGTIDIKDVTEKEKVYSIVKKVKLPKELVEDCGFGADSESSVLNVIGTADGRLISKIDPLSFGKFVKEYYTDRDLAIGAVIFAYGKRIVLTDCDAFTKEYYRIKFGLDDFTKLERPPTQSEEEAKAFTAIKTDLPPYNGYGTYEDSALNCLSITPSLIVKSYKRFYEKDKHGYDSRVLRFTAKLISGLEDASKRSFIISFYVVDDTISVCETCRDGSLNELSCVMMRRRRMYKPNQDMLSSKTPDHYQQDSFYIGSILTLEYHTFLLTGADEYALKYMELHSNEFPKSNINLLMDKVREKVKPRYKEFASQFFQNESLSPISYYQFRNSLKNVFNEEISEHEIVTLARAFRCESIEEKFSLETLRRLTQDELKRQLWDDLSRVREAFLAKDPNRLGSVDRTSAYAVLRGAKIPLDPNLINILIAKFGRSEDCRICYDDLICFLDYNHSPAPPLTPINIAANLSWMNLYKPPSSTEIHYVSIGQFLDNLNLEDELTKQQ